MASAVSKAGGLGSLACAMLDAAALRGLLFAEKKECQNPLNVNFFTNIQPDSGEVADSAWLDCLSSYYNEFSAQPPRELSCGSITPFDGARCAVIEDIRPAVVSFHFGLPGADLVKRIKAVGSKVISSATTVAEVRWLVERGCDAVIAQGYDGW